MSLYYVGPGVVTSGGKDYGFGAKLPDTLSEATISALRKKKRISETAPLAGSAPVSASADDSELAEAHKQLMAKFEEVTAALDEANKTIDKRSAALDEANTTIASLTAQITGTAAPVVPEVPTETAAGPMKKFFGK